MISPALFSAEGSDYVLPAHVVLPLHEKFNFTLSVGGITDELIGVPKMDIRFGLIRPWGDKGDRVLVNPPEYGAVLSQWLEKAVMESKRGLTVVVSCPVRSDTEWFSVYATQAHELRLIKGRIRHEGTPSSAPFPSMFLVFKRGGHPDGMQVTLWSQDGSRLA